MDEVGKEYIMQQYRDDPRYEQANKIDFLSYAQSIGYTAKNIGREYQLVAHDSLKIDPAKNSFYWHSRSKGGGPVQLLCMYRA